MSNILLPRVDYYHEGKGFINLPDLMVRLRVLNDALQKRAIFHPYTLEDWERPDTVAADYYGDPRRYWIVLLSNRILDPFFEWPLPENTFRKHIRNKYGKSIPDLMNDIHHYEYVGYANEPESEKKRKEGWTISPDVWSFLPTEEKGWWSEVSTYDYEWKENEKRRHIRLLDAFYVPQVEEEAITLLRGKT